MIFHIIIDEKFIDMALRDFEAVAPGQNRAIFPGKPRSLRHVKCSDIAFMPSPLLQKAVCSEQCQAVIFHTLNEWSLPILAKVPARKPTIWIGWGFDYYERLLSGAFPNGLLLPKTIALQEQLRKANQRLSKLPLKTTHFFRQLIEKALGRATKFSPRAINRLDYFIPVIEPEYTLARALNPWFHPKYECWNYCTVEDDLSNGSPQFTHGKNILIGNSSTLPNNHLDLFDLLSKRSDIGDRKLIVPLSYGDHQYAQYVTIEGHRLFGDRFMPITDFLPKEQYIELLNSCGYVFMNHIRQQALANICIMMLQGARIYLNPVNPLYAWLKEKGAFIDTINGGKFDKPNHLLNLHPLSELQQHTNRQVIMNYWGRAPQRAKTRRLVDIALQRGQNWSLETSSYFVTDRKS